MRRTIYRVGMNRGMECFLHLTGGAAEFDAQFAAGNPGDAKPVEFHPVLELLSVSFRHAESRGELLRRQPDVKVR